MKSEGILPSEDYEELPFSCTCLLGQTKPLDPNEFPIVDVPDSQFLTVHGHNKPFTVSAEIIYLSQNNHYVAETKKKKKKKPT
jgi:hypothetical protein